MDEIGVAERIEGRDRDGLKGNGETESFERPELGRGGGGGGGAAAAAAQGEVRDGIGTVL